MKLEVIDRSGEGPVATYLVPEVSMLSFQEWKDLIEVVVPLNQLLAVATNISSIDPVTGVPSSVAIYVDLYLPGPLRDNVLERLAKQQMKGDIDSGQFSDLLREATEQFLTPPLKLSSILLAVAEEISRNHLPNDAYTVKISDE